LAIDRDKQRRVPSPAMKKQTFANRTTTRPVQLLSSESLQPIQGGKLTPDKVEAGTENIK
jgi:hypothetical protein